MFSHPISLYQRLLKELLPMKSGQLKAVVHWVKDVFRRIFHLLVPAVLTCDINLLLSGLFYRVPCSGVSIGRCQNDR